MYVKVCQTRNLSLLNRKYKGRSDDMEIESTFLSHTGSIIYVLQTRDGCKQVIKSHNTTGLVE